MSSRRSTADPSAVAGPVAAWRRERLLAAGFPSALAAELVHRDVDLHALLGLVDRGCPPELAARIMAPLDDGPGWSR